MKVDKISGIQCSGNSYDYEACNYLATEVIQKKAGKKLQFADFSNMFEDIDDEHIP